MQKINLVKGIATVILGVLLVYLILLINQMFFFGRFLGINWAGPWG